MLESSKHSNLEDFELTPNSIKDALTVAEFIEATRVSDSTARRYIREGKIKAYRVGGRRLLIPKSELARIAKGVHTAAAESQDRETAYTDLEAAARAVARLGGITPMRRDHILTLIGGGEAA